MIGSDKAWERSDRETLARVVVDDVMTLDIPSGLDLEIAADWMQPEITTDQPDAGKRAGIPRPEEQTGDFADTKSMIYPYVNARSSAMFSQMEMSPVGVSRTPKKKELFLMLASSNR